MRQDGQPHACSALSCNQHHTILLDLHKSAQVQTLLTKASRMSKSCKPRLQPQTWSQNQAACRPNSDL